jgi:signal transduction histidine kinase
VGSLAITRLRPSSLRLRLTLLYSGMFLVAGTILLAIVYVLVAHNDTQITAQTNIPDNATIYTVRSEPARGFLVQLPANVAFSGAARSVGGQAVEQKIAASPSPNAGQTAKVRSPPDSGAEIAQPAQTLAALPNVFAKAAAGETLRQLLSQLRVTGQLRYLNGPLPLPAIPSGTAVVTLRSGLTPADATALKQQVQNFVPLENARKKVESVVAQERSNERSRLLLWSGLALAAMAVISGVLGWLMAGRALAPVRTMTTRARRISEDNLHERLAVAGADVELSELADTFDGVLDRLQSAFEAQRRFVANASHELRTPLTLGRATLEVALADPGADVESLRRACAGVIAAGEEQERLIDGLLTLAGSQRGLAVAETVDLRETCSRAITVVAGAAAMRGIAVDADLRPALAVGDTRLLERLAINLLDNAVRHNFDGGEIFVATATSHGHATLVVSNSGPALDAAGLPELLEPFRRGGDVRAGRGGGHGLGLSIVAAIAEAHGAELRTVARRGGGLEVEVVLACAPGPVPAVQSFAGASLVSSASTH